LYGVAFITTFLLALAASLLLTPLVIRLARRFNILDRPAQRKVHKEPMPLWGGLAVFGGTVIATGAALLLFDVLDPHLTGKAVKMFWGLLGASAIIVVLGMVDDVLALGAKLKLGVQLCAALILYFSGVSITFVKLPHQGYHYLIPALSIGLTLFWIAGIMNALNLLDGLDGLLSGVAVISGLVFFGVAVVKGQVLVAVLLMALVGASLGFLKYNFSPAKIFLGDTGSLFIGLMFAAVSIMGALKTTLTLTFLVPVLIMGVPIFDTAFAIVRRFLGGKPIFSPDKDHVHHRLLRSGISHKNAVAVIYAINLILGLAGLWMAARYK
jgi:UDP-GlcNAc:undecaprenyl-phosphate GlcNAc-1-phosphate transferase